MEDKLKGQVPGYRGQIDLPPEEAYGPHRPELVFEAVRENLPPDLDLQPGMQLSPGGSDGKFKLNVVSLTERGAMLDGNHHLRDLPLPRTPDSARHGTRHSGGSP